MRYAVRSQIRWRGVSTAVLVLLATGIGANTAIFGLIHGILMRPLPGVREPDRLVRFLRTEPGDRSPNFGYPDYVDYREQARLFAGIVAESPTVLSFANGASERISGALVSGNYFSVLGVKAVQGRLLTPEDDRVVGGHWVAVISHGLWQRAFGSDPAVTGKHIRLNGHDYEIVGVAAPEFRGLALGASTEVWLPLMMQPQAIPRLTAGVLGDRMAGWISIYGRLRPGASLAQANTETGAIAQRLARVYPATNQGRGAEIVGDVGLYPDERASLRKLFGLLFAAVGVLLLIACCNAANLFLARAAARRREIAVRLALGAGRWRLIRQALTESLLLCLLAAAAGLLMAPWSLGLLVRLLPPANGGFQTLLHVDLAVLGFTLLLSLTTGLVFGLAPALAASRAEIATSLKAAAPASGFQKSRFSKLSVVAQVSLSLVLLIGAGLAVRTIQHALSDAQGFESGHVMTASLDLSTLDYPETRARLFFAQLLERLSGLPQVRCASLARHIRPAGGAMEGRFSVTVRTPARRSCAGEAIAALWSKRIRSRRDIFGR